MERISTRYEPVKQTQRQLKSRCPNFRRLKPNRKRSARCPLRRSRKARTSVQLSCGFSCVYTRCPSRKIQALATASVILRRQMLFLGAGNEDSIGCRDFYTVLLSSDTEATEFTLGFLRTLGGPAKPILIF